MTHQPMRGRQPHHPVGGLLDLERFIGTVSLWQRHFGEGVSVLIQPEERPIGVEGDEPMTDTVDRSGDI